MAKGGDCSASDYLALTELDPELKIDLANVLMKLKLGSETGLSPAKWFQLGLQLGVPKNDLDIICADHKNDVLQRLSEALNYWIKNGNCKCHKRVTWKVLWEALCDAKVAHTNLGIEIRDWYWKKTWKDPREGRHSVRRTYIQLPGRNPQLRSVKCNPEETGLTTANDTDYFRLDPVVKPHSSPSRIYRGHIDDLKRCLKDYLSCIEPHQKKFKVGYEARFGQIYWKNVADAQEARDSTFWYRKKPPERFSPHISCEIGRLIREKCHPRSGKHCSILVDPIKFVVDLPAHRDVVYVAVVSEVQDVFVLHDVYRKQNKPYGITFDFVQPQRKYDFRLSDCCGLICEVDDEKVRTIAEQIKRSIHKNDDGHLSMQLVGEDYHVKFLRHKKQQVYQWKGKEKQKWYLAEYDVTEHNFEGVMADHEQIQELRARAFKSGKWERSHLIHGVQKKEFELWSRKIFPEGFSSSHPSSRMYIEPEATGEVRMPNASAKSATKWTTEELMEDIDDFVQAAFDITSILEHC